MAQYLLSVHHTEADPGAGMDPAAIQQMYDDVAEFNAKVQANGQWVFAGGLQPADIATVVNAADGDVITTDGPFSETKEYLGGFWVIEAPDLDVALQVAAEGSAACKNPVEVRPFQEDPQQVLIGRFVMTDLDQIFRDEFGIIVAALIRILGDIDLAEDAAAEAFAIAAAQWGDEPPPNPGGWLVTTARRRAIDYLRRESSRQSRYEQAYALINDDAPEEVGPVSDDRLRLMFTCCHPALAPQAQVALTLRLLGGLRTDEIARAFLVPEPTMAQRLSRAKAKIRGARIPYRIPRDAELPSRVRTVLTVVYLIYNEGYAASAGDELTRPDLADEAIRLARVTAELMPDEPEALGLLALLLLLESRHAARTHDGKVVLLPDQDRALWDRRLIDEGQSLVRGCLRRGRPGPYQIQAAIQAVHSDAATADDTDWAQIVALYDQLLAVAPTPVVALNRAVAVAEVVGPQSGLDALADLPLDDYLWFHAARADLLRRVGRTAEARDAYQRALEMAGNQVDREFLTTRLGEAGQADR